MTLSSSVTNGICQTLQSFRVLAVLLQYARRLDPPKNLNAKPSPRKKLMTFYWMSFMSILNTRETHIKGIQPVAELYCVEPHSRAMLIEPKKKCNSWSDFKTNGHTNTLEITSWYEQITWLWKELLQVLSFALKSWNSQLESLNLKVWTP